jgi:hypothetical protein
MNLEAYKMFEFQGITIIEKEDGEYLEIVDKKGIIKFSN